MLTVNNATDFTLLEKTVHKTEDPLWSLFQDDLGKPAAER